MGLLDRLISGVNRAAEPVQDALTPVDPTLKAADRRAREGEAAQGTIVGIRRVLEETTTTDVLAVAVDTPDGVQRFGIQVSGHTLQARMRLGLVVPVRVEKGKAALDAEALSRAWGIDSSISQRSKRGAPDDGVEDKALDSRVQKRLKKWPRTSATIAGLERKQVLGMASVNWDVQLSLADGSTALCPKDEIPFYAWWHTVAGWEVPIAVEPDGGKGRAAVDWAAAAVAAAAPGTITDPVPPGSVAAEVLTPKAAAPVAGMGVAPPPPPATPPGGPVELPFAFQQFLGAAADGAMSRKEVEAAIAEYEAGGLCTPAQAEAARQQLG